MKKYKLGTRDEVVGNYIYLALPGVFSKCQINKWDSLNAKRCPIQINMFGLRESAWFPWQPIMRL